MAEVTQWLAYELNRIQSLECKDCFVLTPLGHQREKGKEEEEYSPDPSYTLAHGAQMTHRQEQAVTLEV